MQEPSGAGLIERVVELSGRPHQERARSLLVWLAEEVEPVMRKHKLFVPLLTEMQPQRPTPGPDGTMELGLNYSETDGLTWQCTEITVCLRRWDRPHHFYSKEELLETMLHELAHCRWKNHSDNFWKYMAELERDLQAIKADRSRFLGNGRKMRNSWLGFLLGRLPGRQTDPRKAAAAAAERRAAVTGLGGPLAQAQQQGTKLSPGVTAILTVSLVLSVALFAASRMRGSAAARRAR